MSAVSVIAMVNGSSAEASIRTPPDRILRSGTVAAVVFAAAGLLSLLAVLLSAAAAVPVWPGLVLLAYVCLPLAFILLAVMVIVGMRRRRRP